MLGIVVTTMKKARKWAFTGSALLLMTNAMLFTQLRDDRRAAIDFGRNFAEGIATIILHRSDGMVTTLDRTLSGIGEAISARGKSPAEDDLYLHQLLARRHAITPELAWLVVTDTEGRTRSSSRSFPPPSIDTSDREYFIPHLQHQNHGIHIGLSIISRSPQSEPVIPISRPLVDDEGVFSGIIIAGLRTEFLHALIDDPRPPDGITIGLYRRGGAALTCLPTRADCPDAPSALMEIVNAMDSAGTAPFKLTNNHMLLSRERGISALQQSGTYPLFVVVDYPERHLLAQWKANLPAIILMVLGTNIALIALGVFGFRQLARRREAMDALTEANRVLEARVQERTEALARLANTDVLTGAHNRRWFMEEGERLFALARRHGHPLTLMVIDADHFKLVNDRYGHAAGDAVLRTLTATSAMVLRATDLFARLGGEEFGVILPDTGAEGAMGLGERLLTAMRETVTEHDGHKLRFTVSIGVAMLEPDDTHLEALLHRADLALYKAKADGRDRLGLIDRP